MTKQLQTLLAAYNAKATELCGNMGITVSESDFGEYTPQNKKQLFSYIDEIVFRRGEYGGGMCHVICQLVK